MSFARHLAWPMVLLPWAVATLARGQEARTLTLEQAVEAALREHPSLARQAAEEEVAAARLDLARAGYLPQLDVALQANRATANLVRGATFPMQGVPTISGPISAPTFDSGAFGTVASLSASWDVLGLLARMAAADAALHDRERARVGEELIRLQVGFNAADLFLGALARQEAVKAARAAEERATVFERTVRALAEHDLRPGADLSRSEAERALASTQLIRAEEAERIAEVELAQAVGFIGRVAPVAGRLLELSPGPPERAPARHPLLAQADAEVAAAGSRERAAGLGYLPRLELVAALWARGSGYSTPGGPSPAAAGLVPVAPDWGAGLVLTWPALELIAQRARVRAAASEARGVDAHRRELELQVATQVETARAVLEGARRVAANTPAALAAARAAEQQATARYQSGLAGVVEVAEAQRLLAQAELEDALARLGVRTATLLLSRALGDLAPFLADVRDAAGGAR